MPCIAPSVLEECSTRIFIGAGLDPQEAAVVSHSLVLANLMGHDSHGVVRLASYLEYLAEGKVFAGKQIQVVREADASAVVDGQWGFGQTVCHQAMNLAMEKAKSRSVGVVELFNSSHIGRLGEYVEAAAENQMIGLVLCNNHGGGELLSPFGGVDARMSPNPLAVGIPSGTDLPIVVDMTTSVVAEGKIRVKRNRGESLPEGWALDADGEPTIDPKTFYGPPRGAILPFGGNAAHKGYALAVVVDILAGALGGGGTSCGSERSGGNGLFIMAIDIEAFTGRDRFDEEVRNFVEHLKSSRLMPGFDEILVPGEVENRTRRQREKDGIEVDDETWRQLGEAGQSVGVPLTLD
jgi:uncharacterized oxidoreductase